MKYLLLLTSLSFPLAALPGSAQEPPVRAAPAEAAKPGPDGMVTLFNGRDLTGWQGDPLYWSVQDGALTGVTDGTLKRNHFITWTGGKVRNFDLTVKVKVTAGGNSGLQYRSVMVPGSGPDVVKGYQCDVVANTPEYNGMLYEEKGRRILCYTGQKVIIAPDGQPWITGTMPVEKFAPDEWHEFRVLVQANHHQHWIDGHLTADVIDLDEKGRSLEGILGTQVHVGPPMKIQYKDFKMKPLPDDLPLLKPENHPVPSGSPGVKPQGELPKDWQPPVYPGK